MSNIYIQEPPTCGKVLLKTTVGDIDIELWSKETPLACRNFIQLCMEGYYDNCIFHRLVKGFIVQTGDPTGTGFGGESIYGRPFKDEFHSRLRFVRRGLVAMANGGEKDDNGSQFFFTLESTPELQNKHTIFGKISGKTLYNMLRLGEGEIDRNERPVYPHKIRSIEILNNPFDDIEPREKRLKVKEKSKEDRARERLKGSKNFALLSFGDEAEEEEEEITKISAVFKNKSKSSHDLLKDDDKLSSIPVVDPNELSNDPNDDHEQRHSNENDSDRQKRLANVKAKLDKGTLRKNDDDNDDDDDDDGGGGGGELDFFTEEKLEKKAKEIEKAKNEFQKLKKQMLKKLRKEEQAAAATTTTATASDNDQSKPIINDAVAEFEAESKKFKEINQKIRKKGNGREQQCLDLLQKFKDRLHSTKKDKDHEEEKIIDNDNNDDGGGPLVNFKTSWLSHRMQCTGDDEIVLARDANIRNEEDWYDIYDPRNPINKRRRNEN
ncbi:spliceosome-associated protein CWC27 homolog [Dermatophagoides farinae]|uniref:spliceosome-associated protein CWC27 homolog n=1 Tax=Dermatophagoides farinae TaxID=6954 RepID=UPI003F63C72F